MKSNIVIFESGISDGIMSRNKKFYDEKLSQEEINHLFLETRIKLGRKYHFDGKKMFQAQQKSDQKQVNYPDGAYIVLDEKNMRKDDFWYEELPADILLITKKYPNVVVGHQMADCPIVIAEDRALGVTALAHCGASYIDRNLPSQIIDALQKEYDSKIEHIYVYIGSCAKKENYVYDTYPTWAKNTQLWKQNIIKQNEKYHIDMTQAIVDQLEQKGIKHIEISSKDTISDPFFYSHCASIQGKENKKGQNFVGFFYQ